VAVHLLSPLERLVALEPEEGGYYSALVDRVAPGADYVFRLDDEAERPDPASRWQPQGVHGPSRVADRHFGWTDTRWRGLPWRKTVLYEVHVGTFSEEGTFEGLIPHLRDLRDLGITALELMPVAQFPGTRNWGYDGVYPFAVQQTYGGPMGLKRFVNAAHEHGLAVVLDVVYNHLGPEGQVLEAFGPYFTDRYRTPWGRALNFDGPDSDEVRRFFIENALYWQTEVHVDALRLDAVHAICDGSAVPFLEELAAVCHRTAAEGNRRFHVIAESDLNSARHILPRRQGGYGLDAQWSDDFHHVLHVLLTGEQQGYYADFGGVSQLAKVWREGYVYTGQYSRHRQRRQGSDPSRNPLWQFVVCSQNHDQIGNRRLGDRLSATLSFEQQKLAAGVVLLSPFVPLLFMGEEYGELAPFQYFVSHTDPALVDAVRQGRREEFAAFDWQGEVPDPQAEATFRRSRLDHALARRGAHRVLREFYRELLALRRQVPAIARAKKDAVETTALEPESVCMVRQWSADDTVLLVFNFAAQRHVVDVPLPLGEWRKRLDSTDARWRGPGLTASANAAGPGRVRLDLPGTALVLYENSPAADDS